MDLEINIKICIEKTNTISYNKTNGISITTNHISYYYINLLFKKGEEMISCELFMKKQFIN